MNACSPWKENRLCVEDVKPCARWELLLDPDGSMPTGGLFTLDDIGRGHDKTVWDCWLAGTKFRNIFSGKILTVYVYKPARIGTTKRYPSIDAILRYRIAKQSDQLELSL